MTVYPVREPRDSKLRTRKEEVLHKSPSIRLGRKQSNRGKFSNGAVSKSIKDTEQFVAQVLKKLKPAKSQAVVLALSGGLGSGKTAFTKILAKNLGIKETVNSPTYVIMKTYKLLPTTYNIQPTTNQKDDLSGKSSFVGRWSRLIHIDAYRLEDAGELARLGWKELVSEPKNLIVVEWAEKVRKILPKNSLWIYFKFVDEETRKMQITNLQ